MPRTTRETSVSRVHLREPREGDLEAFVALRRASREFLERWEAEPPDGVDPFSVAGARRFLAPAENRDGLRLLVCRSADGALLGAVTLSAILRGPLQSATLGYWIGESFARQGYMTEALELALDCAFRKLDLQRVEAAILPENQASRSLAARCGFRAEGVARGYARVSGVRRDYERWAITRDDWRALRRL